MPILYIWFSFVSKSSCFNELLNIFNCQVTFKDPEAAGRACENPNPIIDGRRANCNLAALGAQKNHSATPQPHERGGLLNLNGLKTKSDDLS